jgi:hypothetical protein
MAAETGLAAGSTAQVNSQIEALSSSVQQALAQSGEGSEAYTESEIQSQIQSQAEALVGEKIESEQTQKTNLEEQSQHKHHHVSKATLYKHNYSITHCIAI